MTTKQKRKHGSLREGIIAAFLVIVAIWLISPIPELTLIYILVSGGTMFVVFGSWELAIASTIVGCLLGTLMFRRLKVKAKILNWIETLKES